MTVDNKLSNCMQLLCLLKEAIEYSRKIHKSTNFIDLEVYREFFNKRDDV